VFLIGWARFRGRPAGSTAAAPGRGACALNVVQRRSNPSCAVRFGQPRASTEVAVIDSTLRSPRIGSAQSPREIYDTDGLVDRGPSAGARRWRRSGDSCSTNINDSISRNSPEETINTGVLWRMHPPSEHWGELAALPASLLVHLEQRASARACQPDHLERWTTGASAQRPNYYLPQAGSHTVHHRLVSTARSFVALSGWATNMTRQAATGACMNARVGKRCQWRSSDELAIV
jgi:hypothetical protein